MIWYLTYALLGLIYYVAASLLSTKVIEHRNTMFKENSKETAIVALILASVITMVFWPLMIALAAIRKLYLFVK